MIKNSIACMKHALKNSFRNSGRQWLAIALTFCLGIPNVQAQQIENRNVRPAPKSVSGFIQGRVVVKFKDGLHPVFSTDKGQVTSNIPVLNQLNRANNCIEAKRVFTGRKNINSYYVYTLDFSGNPNVEQLVSIYKNSGVFDVVEPDYLMGINATTPNDGHFWKQWSHFNDGTVTFSGIPSVAGVDMDMKLAWDLTTGSSSVIVAIIDAGVKWDHPEFSGRIWENAGEIAGNGVDDDGNGFIDDTRGWDWVNNDNNPMDDHGHGTNVAGITGATGNNSIGYAGVDWNCKIMALKTLSASGTGSSSFSTAAIYYATEEGAKVINMSLGSSSPSSLAQDAVNYAYANNVLVVAAMGNDNVSTPFYPAAYTHVMAVGATMNNDRRAAFSNFGSHISVAAPGWAIFGLSHTSNTNYDGGMSGTSQATPQVSGIASLMLALDPLKTPDQIKSIIELTAEDQVGLATEDVAGFDHYFGHGRVNAYQALLYCTTPNAITGTTELCVGGTTTLATTTTGGAWSSSTTSVATINSSGVVNGIAAGTTIITYTKLACSRTIKVTVKPLPSSVTPSPTSASVCLGAGSGFTASATASQVSLLSQNWDAGLLNGWTVTNINGTGESYWQIRNSPGWGGNVTGDGTPHMESVPFATTLNSNSKLTSPAFSTLGYTTCSLSYNQKFFSFAGDITVQVEYSINGGSSWSTLVNQLGTGVTPATWSAASPQVAIELPGAAANAASVMIRWNYNSTNGGIWAVDNISVTGKTAVTYAWTGISGATGISCSSCASTTITPASGGSNSYSVVATANGCSTGATVTVTANALSISAGSGVAICNGASTGLTATGGTTYTWSPATGLSATTGASVTASPTVTTTYTVTGTTGGCTGTATKTVTVNSVPSVSAGAGVSICNGTSTGLTATGGTTYTWSPGTGLSATTGASVTANPTVTTTYTVVGTTGSCSGSATKTVTVNNVPSISAGSGVSICNGTSTGLTATGGTTYTWSPATGLSATTGASVTASPTVTTTYTVTGTTSGCSGNATKTVTVNSVPTVDAGGSVSICEGSGTTLSATGASTYTWAPGTGLSATTGASVTASPTVTTTYTITGTTSGCSGTTTKTVNVDGTLSISAGADVSICHGSSTSLTATGASNYTWTPGTGLSATTGANVVANPTVTTTYTISGTSGSCSGSGTITVNVGAPISVSAGADVSICNGTSTGLTATGGTTYTWAPGSSLSATTGASVTATPTITTTYTVTGTTTGCSATATKTVTVNSSPTVSAGSGVNICNGTSTGLTATGASTYTWTPATGLSATTGADVTASPTITTTYTVVGTASGCTGTATKTVTVIDIPSVSAGTNVSICNGTSTALTATGAATYLWSPGTGLSATTGATVTASPTVTTTYTVTGTTSGCSSIATKTVTVNSTPSIGAGADVSICNGTSTGLSATGGTTYTWAPATGLSASTGANVTATPTITTTYTVTGTTSGCSGTATQTVTVNSVPSVSAGAGVSICEGSSTTLTATGATTYIWSPGTGLSATTGASVTASPTTTTTYTVTGTTAGCSSMATKTVTVNGTLSIGAGAGAGICIGGSTGLTATGGTTYTWAPATGLSATTGANVTASPTVTTTYTITGTAGECSGTATTTVTVNSLPTIDAGSGVTICGGSSTVLTATGGSTYTWTPGSSLSATTGASVTASPTVTTTYTVTGTNGGCSNVATVTVTIGTSITPIEGILGVCMGSTTTLTNSSGGGTWASSNGTIALVGSATGVVTGVNVGTVEISYIVGSCYSIAEVTVYNPLPAIGGTPFMCIGGAPAILNHVVSGGTWTSSIPAIASIDASTGAVTGHTAGVTNITYSIGTGCSSSTPLTINPAPTPISIVGPASVCEGATAGLTNLMGSGTWSSSDAAVATIGSVSGILTGITPGTAIITYTQYTGCATTRIQTVNMVPASVTGTAEVCAGNTTVLSTVTTGGYWVSSHTGVATVDSTTGVVTGVTGGLATVRYEMPTGCSNAVTVTVNNLPAAISGTLSMCEGGTTTLSSTTSGGTWTSSAPGTAAIGSTGLVNGISAGVATISYTNSNGCTRTTEVTVNTVPPGILGSASICIGSTSALSNATTGGTWSSSNTARVTVGLTTGIVSGVSIGTANITYRVAGSGCFTVLEVTVNSTPASITGTTNVCVGAVTTLSHPVGGGTWASSNSAVGTVDASTGDVTGIMVGTTIITYTVSAGCFKTIVVNVQALPVLTTTGQVCEGATMAIGYYPTGGTWASSSMANATVGATGVVTGVLAGTTLISYTKSPGCMTTREITVNPIPSAITGNAAICAGSTETLSSTPAGGTWASSVVAKATVGSSSGDVTGIAAGNSVITYTAAGCRRTIVVTVGSMPAAITGVANVCAGSTTTLACSPTGGTWNSSNTAAATIPTTGVGLVTGIDAGVTTISYTRGGCVRMATVTVNAALTAIGGDLLVCAGNATALSNATGGGTWASSTPAKATINITSGIATGVSAGSSNITYRTSTTCFTTAQLTVNGAVSAITGTTNVCVGATTALSIAATGGTWSSANTARATVDEMSGVVTGVGTGTVVISYIQSTGCYKTVTVVVNSLPAAIGGTATVCQGSATVLTNTTGGGTWSSSLTSVATVTSGGSVTGVSEGLSTITYRLSSTGCIATREVTVNPLPSISGSSHICAGTTSTFTGTPTGGTWASSTTSVATVGSSSGDVTGLINGASTLTYTLPTGCRRTQGIIVNPMPNAIMGTATVFVGMTTTLTSTTGGGTWSSSDVAIATVGTGAGIVTGVDAGTATITYQLTATGCYRTREVTVNYLAAGKGAATEMEEGSNAGVSFNVYPNPTSGILNIQAGVNGVFTVYTLDGKTVEQYAVTAATTTIVSLPNNLAAGVYMCRFVGEDGSANMVRLVYRQ